MSFDLKGKRVWVAGHLLERERLQRRCNVLNALPVLDLEGVARLLIRERNSLRNRWVLKSMKTNASVHTLDWMVVTTLPHREEFAIENLVRQDYNAYCPMMMRRIRHARRTYDAKRPLFPGYVFVERPSQRQSWRPLLGTFGVRSVVCHGERPSLLPPGFVESLKVREIDGTIRKPELPFKPGQLVAISGGALDGLVGQILEIRESDRVLLLLNLLNQQTRVQVDAKMLRSA